LIGRVFQYSFAQAKTRTMKGNLLSAEDWHYLAGMKGLDEILRYLSGTRYAAALSGLSGAMRDSRLVTLALYENLFGDYAKLIRTVPARGAKLLRSLLLRYDAENLKVLLRGVWQDVSPVKTRSLLYPLDSMTRLPLEDLLALRREQVTKAADLLKPTLFHAPFLLAMPQFKAQGNLFPLEIAVDRSALDHIVESMKAIGIFAQKEAKELTGELIDWVNLTWLVRFRHVYGLSPEETINYTVRGGYRLGIRELGAIARTTDLSTFVAAAPEPYRAVLGEADGWRAIPILFQRWFIGELTKSFQRDPFQIGLEVSYLLLKEMEVKSLESLMSAVDLGASPEKLLGLVSLPVKGGVSV
jgi:V/A-type H+/Na+-transporting ATPase subunit C